MFNLRFKKLNILNIEIPNAIFYLIILSSILNLLRVIIWGKMSFLYIFWNLFLALIPFIVSLLLLEFHKKGKLKILIFIIGTVIWLLFIPNAPYLVTDFIHLGESRTIPILFDTILLFSSAYLGMIFFFYSLSHMEEIIKKFISKKWTIIVIIGFILLISLGIYIGRFLRFNSWDIFINHYSLLKNIWKIFTENSVKYWNVYWFTLLFSFFLSFSYFSWKSIQSKQT
jgi:uncharacterized membrane protein